MMTVTAVMSSSSSTATVLSMESLENTRLGHWARTRLRMISRRLLQFKGQGSRGRAKEEENRLDPKDKDVRTLGHTPPQVAHLMKDLHISKIPQQPKTQVPILFANFRI